MHRLGSYIAVGMLAILFSVGAAHADTIVTLSDAQLQLIQPASLGANVTSADCAYDSGQVNCSTRFTGTVAWASQSFGAAHLSGLNYNPGDSFGLNIVNSNGSVWTWTIKVYTDDGIFTETASFGPTVVHPFLITLNSGSSIEGIEIIAGGPIPNTSTGSNDRLINFDILAATGQTVLVSESGALPLLTVGLLAAGLARRRKL
jgi:hypothetical protein